MNNHEPSFTNGVEANNKIAQLPRVKTGKQAKSNSVNIVPETLELGGNMSHEHMF